MLFIKQQDGGASILLSPTLMVKRTAHTDGAAITGRLVSERKVYVVHGLIVLGDRDSRFPSNPCQLEIDSLVCRVLVSIDSRPRHVEAKKESRTKIALAGLVHE